MQLKGKFTAANHTGLLNQMKRDQRKKMKDPKAHM